MIRIGRLIDTIHLTFLATLAEIHLWPVDDPDYSNVTPFEYLHRTANGSAFGRGRNASLRHDGSNPRAIRRRQCHSRLKGTAIAVADAETLRLGISAQGGEQKEG
jgi:hypothetical protein